MTMKVYTSTFNRYNSGRVIATLFEKDATNYEFVHLNLLDGAHEEPEFKRLQPFGKVPALVDGDLTIFESRAIIRYLEHQFKGRATSLYGGSLRDQALVDQWLEVEGQTYNPLILNILREKVFKADPEKMANEAVVDYNIEKLCAVLDVYEAHLSKSKYLAGDFFSLADLTHLPETNLLISELMRGDLIESRPHVKAWWEEISSRTSWKKVVSMMTY